MKRTLAAVGLVALALPVTAATADRDPVSPSQLDGKRIANNAYCVSSNEFDYVWTVPEPPRNDVDTRPEIHEHFGDGGLSYEGDFVGGGINPGTRERRYDHCYGDGNEWYVYVTFRLRDDGPDKVIGLSWCSQTSCYGPYWKK